MNWEAFWIAFLCMSNFVFFGVVIFNAAEYSSWVHPEYHHAQRNFCIASGIFMMLEICVWIGIAN